MMAISAPATLPGMDNVRSLDRGDRANLERAFRRAVAENLVAYPLPDGRWLCKTYALNVKGPAPLEVDCECADAIYRERLCKHAACVAFCRLYGFVPCPPAGHNGESRLPDCVDDFVARAMDQRVNAA
ncbi:MAG TPA: hypothetical protein VN837_02365 [Chloroflexota bacterium]|nr:hypothetical protein [Chloroflexota bacterium]